MGYNEMQSLTVNGNCYNSFPDQMAREAMAEKIPRPAGSAEAGQYLAVGAVDESGAVCEVLAVDAPETAVYELPVGGEELGGVKNGGNVFINTDGTMTAPESTVTGEQVEAAVSGWLDDHPEATTTVAEGSITTEKLADDAVTTEKLEGITCVNRLVSWELLYDGVNTSTSKLYMDENSALYVLHLEQGKTYFIAADPYPAPVNKMPEPAYEDNSYPGYYFAYSSAFGVEAFDGTIYFPTANQISNGADSKVFKALYTNGYCEDPTGYYGTSQTYASGYFTMLKDVWLYRAALKPTDGMVISSRKILEVAPDFAGEGFSITDSSGVGTPFKFDLGDGIERDPSVYATTALMEIRAESKHDRIYAAMSRDVPRDRSLRLMFIGDSITYAASNAGLQHAFRKYVSMNLNAIQNNICQSGVSVTTGSGSFDWEGSTGTSYVSEKSGFAGLVTKMPQTEVSFKDKLIAEGTDIVIVELGTNDFWNDAPLGSVSDLTDDATFYGAVEKTIALLEETFPNAQIMWVLPFKNSRWTTANGAGNTLMEYLIALKILCQTHQRVWVLDLFDKWYLDYDNESVRSKFFIDEVHITGNAHKCVAEAMIDKIRQIVAVCGLKRIEQPVWYASTDSRYGT